MYRGWKWYYSLTNERGTGLYDVNREAMLNETIISKECLNYRREKSRKYRVFKYSSELLRYMLNKHDRKRAFHEIVPTNRCQKPRFDIDIEKEDNPNSDIYELADTVKDKIITACIEILSSDEVDISIEQFAIYCSHGQDNGKEKASYHIIIDRVYHQNCYEAKGFYLKVLEKIEDRYHRWIDRVYKKNQSFRMLHCSKTRSVRKKRFLKQFTYLGEQHEFKYIVEVNQEREILYEFMTSLLSYTDYCICLPNYYVQKDFIYEEIKDIKIDEALNLLPDYYPNHKSIFRIYKIEYNKIQLLNIDRYDCLICDRIHTSQNPFLIISNGEVRFYCGQSGKLHLKLGNIGITSNIIYERSREILKEYTCKIKRRGKSNKVEDVEKEEKLEEEWNPSRRKNFLVVDNEMNYETETDIETDIESEYETIELETGYETIELDYETETNITPIDKDIINSLSNPISVISFKRGKRCKGERSGFKFTDNFLPKDRRRDSSGFSFTTYM